ncbi:hypothetical protein C4E22_01935 [ANME-1 cluster archaeon AG-394-G06]|nr:hypothetical protein [ANME-1 cluster archaeon AG-394-G06]
MSHGVGVLNSVIGLIAEKRPLLYLGFPGFLTFVIGVFFGLLLLQQYNQTRYFSLAYAMLVAIFMILGAIELFMGIRDELRITNVGFGKLSTNICPLIESEEVVRLRAADGFQGWVEEGACVVY